MPLLPAQTFSHISSTLSPSDVTTPRPVTTTRRLFMKRCPLSVVRRQSCSPSRTGSANCTTDHGQLTTDPSLLVCVLLDVVDGLTHGLDLLGLLVGDRELELVLELHHEFYGVERVSVQVVDEVRLAGDLALVDAHLLADDLDDLLIDVFHCLFHLPASLQHAFPATVSAGRAARASKGGENYSRDQ